MTRWNEPSLAVSSGHASYYLVRLDRCRFSLGTCGSCVVRRQSSIGLVAVHRRVSGHAVWCNWGTWKSSSCRGSDVSRVHRCLPLWASPDGAWCDAEAGSVRWHISLSRRQRIFRIEIATVSSLAMLCSILTGVMCASQMLNGEDCFQGKCAYTGHGLADPMLEIPSGFFSLVRPRRVKCHQE